VRTAVLTINMTHRGDRSGLKKQEIEEQLRRALALLPGYASESVWGAGKGYVLVLAGADGRALAQHAKQVERELRTLPGIGAVTSNASLLRPELIVRPDFSRAADLGVTSAAIAETLRIATTGDHDRELAKLNLSERQVPVVVRLADEARDDLETIKRLPVPGRAAPYRWRTSQRSRSAAALRRSRATTACATSISRSS
jgi:multidrug efflux pump subunit AcrB